MVKLLSYPYVHPRVSTMAIVADYAWNQLLVVLLLSSILGAAALLVWLIVRIDKRIFAPPQAIVGVVHSVVSKISC